MSATTTLVGNTTADVELRFTQSGKAVGSVTVAVSDRVKDASTGEWKDGKVWFARGTMWGDLAEHAAASIPKGTRVVAFGRIEQRDWEDKDGNKRTSVEVTIDEIGPSLRYGTAHVTRATSGGATAAASPAAEPWASPAPTTATPDSWGTPPSYSDDTPF